MDAFVLWTAATAVGVLVAWVHHEYFQKISLFELEDQKSVLSTAVWLPDAEHMALFATGIQGITRHEWKFIKKRVAKEVSRHLGMQDLNFAAWAALNGQLGK